jgi:poly-gamma-glutamate capsule biosynthesis protein CapA/YwtB (metallophosphatase superfamily)
MLGRGVGAELASRPPPEVWDPELRALAATLDGVVANLECCLSERGAPTTRLPGKPFFFRGPLGAVGALEAIGVRAVTLANNHALDFGPEALADTVDGLAGAGIATAGAGRDVAAARRPGTFDVAGRRVAVVAVSDHPAEYAATGSEWGVAHAPLRDTVPDWLLDAVAAAGEAADLVIVAPHWGPNMRDNPAPWQLAAARAFQDAGADLVAGHSAHLVHGVGWTAAGPLLYDLGDALDDYRVDAVLRNDLGVLAIWRPGAEIELELVGLRLDYAHTALATGEDADWLARRLARACGELGTAIERVGEQRYEVRPAA